MLREQRRRARAELASAAAKAKTDPGQSQRVAELRRDYRAIAAEDYIRELVASWPPLEPSQRDRLALLLRGGDAA